MAQTSADEAALAHYATALADAVEAAVPGWVLRSILERVDGPVGSDVREAVDEAGVQALEDVGPRLRALLARDVDDQPTGPLALLRGAVRFPTAVLERLGVAAVRRDAFAERAFPDDVYDLSPASFADVDPALVEPGLVWGAAKAHVILARRRAEGRR